MTIFDILKLIDFDNLKLLLCPFYKLATYDYPELPNMMKNDAINY